MKNYTVVKRYARALLALGKDDGQYRQYGQELKQLAEAFSGAGDLARTLVSPVFPDGLKRRTLDLILEKAKPSPMVGNFVRLLMDKGRLADFADIAEAYNSLADAEKGLVRAHITSAAPLSKGEIEGLRKALNQFADRQVELTVELDPAIIGGLVAKLGDLTIDGSVRSQIGKLAGLLDRI